MDLRSSGTRDERRKQVEKELKLNLLAIGKAESNDSSVVHCENHIGAITIPLGVAGPVRIHGHYAKGEYYVPLATSEGALVASIARGMKAASSGGVITQVEKVGVTRGPVFSTQSLEQARKLEQWMWDRFDELAAEAEKTSKHLTLTNADIRQVGRSVYVRFNYDTDSAMGMNMATIATQHIAQYICRHTKATLVAVAGNFDIDKKPAWLNVILRRGYVVQAEATISSDIVRTVLKTDPHALYTVWKAKCVMGSAISGSIGMNAHHANTVAAFFAATGQDLAHVVDGSLGITSIDVLEDGSLYGMVYLPAILLGTVGGGTKLATQTEARTIIGSSSPLVLAEVLGAAVLAGELSLLASLAEGSLAKSHSRLGR